MPSTLNEYLDKAMKGVKLNEMEGWLLSVLLKKLGFLNIEIRNQLKLDGYDKEADKIFLKASDLIKEIKKVYK